MIAKQRLDAMMTDAAHYRHWGENRHTWKAAVVEWSKAASQDVKPTVLKRYLVSIKQLRHLLDDLYVDEVGRPIISKIARRPGVTNATRRRDLTAVSAVLRWCVAHGWAEDNIARTWDRSVIRERRNPIMLPEPDHIDMVVAAAPDNFGRLIRWAQYTGMREEECASLERPQVSTVRRAADLSKTKTSRPRSVPLDERALGTYAGTVPHLKSRFVFWHSAGERYGNVASRFAAITRRVDAKAKKAGGDFRRFRFHDLRHLFAVDYLRSGRGSIYDLQKILGHASIKTTELYLDFLTPDEQERAKRSSVADGSAQKPAQ